MPKKNYISRQLGLELGLILCRYLFKTEDLHFGYWPDDLPVEILNLPVAQENHSELIIKRLPIQNGRLLDVGCGAGSLACRLLNKGLSIDGVVPSAFLANKAREALNACGEIFESYFEDLETQNQYDLILFSESFQYINIEKGLDKVDSLLCEGGHLLICDFFDKESPHVKSVKGGHKWSIFNEAIAAGPWNKIEDIDITKETARTLDLVKDVMSEVALPAFNLIGETFWDRHPLLTRIANVIFKKRIEKVRTRYLNERMSAASFEAAKCYRLMIFQKT